MVPAHIKDTSLNKAYAHHYLETLVQEKLDAVNAELASTLEARNADTKSSAGDKHEVARAMVQQELDQLEEQRSKWIALQQELTRVPLDRVFDKVAFGSLVTTDQGNYFIAIGLGAISVNGETGYAISLASPIGQAMNGKAPGEAFIFQGRRITVRSVQ